MYIYHMKPDSRMETPSHMELRVISHLGHVNTTTLRCDLGSKWVNNGEAMHIRQISFKFRMEACTKSSATNLFRSLLL